VQGRRKTFGGAIFGRQLGEAFNDTVLGWSSFKPRSDLSYAGDEGGIVCSRLMRFESVFGRATRFRSKRRSIVGRNARPSRMQPGQLPAFNRSTIV
jgi:hypothetical protein